VAGGLRASLVRECGSCAILLFGNVRWVIDLLPQRLCVWESPFSSLGILVTGIS